MPYESLHLGFKFSIRLSDLTARDAVIFTCDDCHARYTVAPHAMLARYHEMKLLKDIAMDFKCRRCNGKRHCGWYLVRAKGPEWPRSA